MIAAWSSRRVGPLGLDLGSQSVKLLQLSRDRRRVVAAARINMRKGYTGPPLPQEEKLRRIRQSLEDGAFRGRQVVLALGGRDLVVQNLRVPAAGSISQAQVLQELGGRVPFPLDQAEVRFLTAGKVASPEGSKQELIVLVAPQERVWARIRLAQSLGLEPVGIEAEPLALLRCAARALRRKEDQHQCYLLIHTGAEYSLAVVAQGHAPRVIKYLAWGSDALDKMVAQRLQLELAEAASLRRYHGERRSDRQDPQLRARILDAIRPLYEKLAAELSLCIRYHSITYRAQSVRQLFLSGGEASSGLASFLGEQLQVPCRLMDPRLDQELPCLRDRPEQWTLAAGLALRPDAPADA